MSHRKKIILKLTGELLRHTDRGFDASALENIAGQIKQLSSSYTFGIVTGGGNFFRGSQQSPEIGISLQTGHYVGMLATMMNGLIIQDIFEHAGIATTLFSAVPCDTIGLPLSPQAIRTALESDRCLLFAGGMGNPFLSTDTTAVIRALQIGATELWKGTKVDGVYSEDPLKNPQAQRLAKTTYKKALHDDLHIMDAAAFALADPHNLIIRIFNIFHENALLKAAHEKDFGSTISHS